MKILTKDLPSGIVYNFNKVVMSPAPAPAKPKIDPNTRPSPDKKPKVDPWNPPKPKISPRPKA